MYLRLMYVYKRVICAFSFLTNPCLLTQSQHLCIYCCGVLLNCFRNVEPDLIHLGFRKNKVRLIRPFHNSFDMALCLQ